MTLYRNKTGSSHKLMEKLFGWCDSSLQEWHETVLIVMDKQMYRYHQGFLTTMGELWQEEEIATWKLHHLCKGDFALFKDRVKHCNEEAARKRLEPRINEDIVEGSLGAFDGTYSVRPRILPKTLEAHSCDPSHHIILVK